MSEWLRKEENSISTSIINLYRIRDQPFQPDSSQFLILLFVPLVVLHVPQVISAALFVPMPVDEPLLVAQAESDGEHDEQLLDNAVVDPLGERLNLGPVPPHHLGLRPTGVLRYELGDVVDLKIVLDAWHQGARARRLPAVVVAVLEGRAEGPLVLIREGQDGLGQGELGVNFCFAETVPLYIKEP